MSSISDSEPSSYEDDVEYQVCKYAMTKEYHSIMKNDVWDIVPRPKRKLVVNFQMDLQDKACCRWKCG